MAVAALCIYAIFLLLAGGVRTWIQRRRTGDTGARHGRVGSAQWWASTMPDLGSILSGAIAPAADLLSLDLLPGLDAPAMRITGAILAVLGILATFAAQLAMGTSWRIGVDRAERTTLVTTGPFRLVRHPIYTAVIGTVAGLTLMVPNPIALAGLAATMAGIQLTVRLVEEPYLCRVHPSYPDYAVRVGRFLPGIGRLRPHR